MASSGPAGWGGQSMTGTLRRVLVFPPVSPAPDASWQEFGYLRPIDHELAVREHAAFRQILTGAGVEVLVGEIENHALTDAIFPFDPVITTNGGAILCRMGKPLREPEVDLAERTMRELGIPIAGRIVAPGRVEGGDTAWIDERTLAVGHGYRTNAAGIAQLQAILRPQAVEVIAFDLPYWHGAGECLHLLSLISMLDRDLAVVYKPLMAVRLLEILEQRGITLVETPDEEFATQGCNVLSIAPRHCVVLRENTTTAQRLEVAGCQVTLYAGDEISHNRTGGPTCLTRPILRDRL